MWGGFNTALEYTNTTEFCLSCHEMKVGEEWRESTHFQNPSGVTAGCPDCHVPKEWTAKVARKIAATSDLYYHILGTIDTPEKFEAKRPEMAERVWARMTASGSRECKNCHAYESMDFHNQSQRAQEKMQPASEKDTPCVECHTGLAHKRPPRDD
ncbi:cytochrome c-type protein NapC [Aliiruegeria lutimaris]|uniref:Cytochrome c-type protein n=2 Tax=Aliiruegeria lutimaris TaxID=571298 RepID=A0A1G9QIJ0_9RHOB|nr:cytochrome c-type protein NapC [Aliiruegeria lutimaris]